MSIKNKICMDCDTLIHKISTRCKSCSVKGRKHSVKSKEKMSELAKGRIISDEQKQKISATLKRKHSAGVLKATKYWLGKKQNGETIKKKSKTYWSKSKNERELIARKISESGKRINPATAKRVLTKRGYLVFGYNGKTHYDHRFVFLRDNLFGLLVIPDGWDVHHINFDRQDNRFENFMLLPNYVHTKLHAEIRRGEA